MTLLHSFFDLTCFYRLGQKYKNIFIHFLVWIKFCNILLKLNDLYNYKKCEMWIIKREHCVGSAHSVCTNYILSSNELSSCALKKKMSCFATQKLSWYKIEVKKMKFAISFTRTLKDISGSACCKFK